MTFLASFSGEMGTKRAATQKVLKELVVKNLSSRAKILGFSLKIEKFYGRLKIESQKGIENLLLSHFGLGRVAQFFPITSDFDWHCLLPQRPFTFEIYLEKWEDSSCKEEALSLKRKLLSFLEEESLKRLSSWDNHPLEHLRFYLEGRREGLFLLKDPKPAPGGLPVGFSGRVLLLFSGGPDSILAAWLLLRRGLEVVLLFFDDQEEGRAKLVEETAAKLAFFTPQGKFRFLRYPFRKHLLEIQKGFSTREQCFYCKSLMLEIGKGLLTKVEAEALATGEILGEQASQTLPALRFISFGKGLVLRPVLTFTKEEVFAKLVEIGWEGKAKLPPCPFTPRRPRTLPRKDPSKILKTLQKLAKIAVKVEEKFVYYGENNEDRNSFQASPF